MPWFFGRCNPVSRRRTGSVREEIKLRGMNRATLRSSGWISVFATPPSMATRDSAQDRTLILDDADSIVVAAITELRVA